MGKRSLTTTNDPLRVEDQLSLLREMFPESFIDDKVDLQKLRQALGEHVYPLPERYELNWVGKASAVKAAQEEATGRLIAVPEKSVPLSESSVPVSGQLIPSKRGTHILVEGDNLEVLKLLQQEYAGRIKMLYIDPPYNTGKEFVYSDNFMGMGHGDCRHSNWLSMMYPRLCIGRMLLCEDGVAVVHIDEHELHNLLQVMCEIFGEENALGTVVWDKKNPKGDASGIAYQHESLVIFAKNREVFSTRGGVRRSKPNARRILEKAAELYHNRGTRSLQEINKQFAAWLRAQHDLSGGEAAYSKIDENGDVYQSVSMAWPNKKKPPEEYFVPLIHPVTGKPCPVPSRGWRNTPETMERLIRQGDIIFGHDETTQPRRKYLLRENMYEKIPSVVSYGGSDDDFLASLGIPFEHPKPYRFAMDLISWFAPGKDDIILDFFAGSGTTGHAVMELNAIDGGHRSFLLVQNPAPTGHPCFPTIIDITMERLGHVVKTLNEQAGQNIHSVVYLRHVMPTRQSTESRR